MMRWQYRIVNLGSFFAAGRLQANFARLGADGWELVTVYDKASNWMGGFEKGFALFKRPVEDGADPDGGWAIVDGPDGKPIDTTDTGGWG